MYCNDASLMIVTTSLYRTVPPYSILNAKSIFQPPCPYSSSSGSLTVRAHVVFTIYYLMSNLLRGISGKCAHSSARVITSFHAVQGPRTCTLQTLKVSQAHQRKSFFIRLKNEHILLEAHTFLSSLIKLLHSSSPLKVWWQNATLFVYFFNFFKYIHSITFIQYIYPSLFAGASLHLLL
jgi:hypothetical protein